MAKIIIMLIVALIFTACGSEPIAEAAPEPDERNAEVNQETPTPRYTPPPVTTEILSEPEPTPDIRRIPIRFFAYEAPDFTSNIIIDFPPGYVELLESRDCGWAAIDTEYGELWIYLPSDRFYVPRVTGLFDYVGQETYQEILQPQVVTIIGMEGDWFLIDTDRGARWINTSFEPSTAGLTASLARFDNSLSVFFMDINSGFTFMHNPDRSFFSASVNKIQHALYVYHLAETGEIDLGREHTFTESDYWGGTGIMRQMSFGRVFTTQELLTMSIRNSDNIAFRILVRRYGLSGYMDFVRSIGADESLVQNITGSNITARDAGLWALAVHEYITSDGLFANVLKTDMLNTNMTLVRADYPIASKYGWATASFHELAIVYADNPYIVVILSNFEDGAFSYFINISRQLQEFHRRYFR